jgi:CubicO group peptidase (beta-lactamase class C family)
VTFTPLRDIRFINRPVLGRHDANNRMMKKFFLGLGLGLAVGIGLGVLICVAGFFIYKQVTTDQEAKDSQIQEQIEAKAEPWEGSFLSESKIAELAKIYLANKHNFGLVIGVCTNNHTRIYGYGRISSKLPQPPDGDSVFEIGSITKTFTGLTLGLMVTRNEIGLDDSLANVLPPQVKIPDDAGKLITLKHLITHTAGLPRVPENLGDLPVDNPYRDYSTKKMYDALNVLHVKKKRIGRRSEYSNFGVGLLGHILALKSGRSYDDLVLERICRPGGLTSTRQFPTAQMKPHLVPGHDDGREVSHWDFDALAGCGALNSSANDLLRYANLYFSTTNSRPSLGGGEARDGSDDNGFGAAVDLATTVQFENRKDGDRLGLAWQIDDINGTDIYFHDGGTGGFCSYLAFNKANRRAVVVLSNSTADVNAIGAALAKTVLVAP